MKVDIIERVVESIVDEYKESGVSFINDKDKFLNLFVQEYDVIIKNKLGNASMITNPEAFNSVDFKDINQLKEIIETQLYKKLYTNDYISESEYKNLCQEK